MQIFHICFSLFYQTEDASYLHSCWPCYQELIFVVCCIGLSKACLHAAEGLCSELLCCFYISIEILYYLHFWLSLVINRWFNVGMKSALVIKKMLMSNHIVFHLECFSIAHMGLHRIQSDLIIIATAISNNHIRRSLDKELIISSNSPYIPVTINLSTSLKFP